LGMVQNEFDTAVQWLHDEIFDKSRIKKPR
jgi:hypothetical protein